MCHGTHDSRSVPNISINSCGSSNRGPMAKMSCIARQGPLGLFLLSEMCISPLFILAHFPLHSKWLEHTNSGYPLPWVQGAIYQVLSLDLRNSSTNLLKEQHRPLDVIQCKLGSMQHTDLFCALCNYFLKLYVLNSTKKNDVMHKKINTTMLLQGKHS